MVTGRRYGGTEARAAGIVEHATTEAEVLPTAVDLAGAGTVKAGATLVAIKTRLYERTLAALAGS
jgi:enoyl-CoA hydratase/carnithine racemase